LPARKTFRLVAETRTTPLVDELLVDFVVTVHGRLNDASLPPIRISIAASAPRSKPFPDLLAERAAEPDAR